MNKNIEEILNLFEKTILPVEQQDKSRLRARWWKPREMPERPETGEGEARARASSAEATAGPPSNVNLPGRLRLNSTGLVSDPTVWF